MNINPVTFGKKYITKVPVQNNKTGEKELMNFVQYDTKDDVFTIENTSKIWYMPREVPNISYSSFDFNIPQIRINGDLASMMTYDMKKHIFSGSYKFYGIEDENNEIQALCEIKSDIPICAENMNDREEKIELVIVNPKNSYDSKNRKYSKLGTVMFKKIVQLAKENNAVCIKLTDITGGFWNKVPYVNSSHKYFCQEKILDKKDYDKCLEKLDEII